MSFNSFCFIFLFLPLSFCGYFVLNRYKRYQIADWFMVIMSCVFFAYNSIWSLLAVWISIMVNYGILQLMKKENHKKALLITGIVINVGSLLCLKYFNFFIENCNQIFHLEFQMIDLLIPLGISYFTFQQIAYLVDNYRGEVPDYRFGEYCLFILFFPKALAGPIVLHDEIMPQFRDMEKRKIDYSNISRGLYAISIGMAKKVLIADKFGSLVDAYYGNLAGMNTTATVLAVLGFTFQLYFDFSGYCDMATGISFLFNIELPVNFDSPYKSYTISEFWDRWHITLTKFFTKYIYIPLGGSRRGKVRTYVNILIVFLLSGLWHGAAWTFVIWGMLHGIMSVVTRAFRKYINQWNQVFSWMVTFIGVNIAWIFFRAGTVGDVKAVIWSLLSLDFGSMPQEMISVFDTKILTSFMELVNMGEGMRMWLPCFVMVAYFLVAFVLILNFKNVYEQIKEFRPTSAKAVFAAILLLASVLSFSKVGTFLYVGF